ncbi:hypothetical protein EOM86_01380 [Candidatus Nomurabacteria bacterium]|nr:hypothetical protein [Candidatus Nomurabacteria bacterium]
MFKKTLTLVMTIVFMVSAAAFVSADSDLTAQYASTAPTIDGSMGSGEWGDVLFRIEDGLTDVHASAADPRIEDFSADIYAQWDDDNLYVLVVADYEEHENDYPANEMYMEDCLQLAIGPNTSKTTARNEFGFALATDLSTKLSNAWFEVVADGIDDVDFEITRSGRKTVYEMAIPWNAIAEQSDVDLVGDGHTIFFSAAFCLGRDGGWLAIEYMTAIIGSKEVAQAAEVTLEKQESTSSSASSQSDNVQTGDNAPVALMVVSALLLATVITTKVYRKRSEA